MKAMQKPPRSDGTLIGVFAFAFISRLLLCLGLSDTFKAPVAQTDPLKLSQSLARFAVCPCMREMQLGLVGVFSHIPLAALDSLPQNSSRS